MSDFVFYVLCLIVLVVGIDIVFFIARSIHRLPCSGLITLKHKGKKDREMDQYLTIRQLVKRWGVSDVTLAKWRNTKGLPFTKTGHFIVHQLADVEKFEKDHNLIAGDFLTGQQLAARWGVTRSAIFLWRKKYGLPCIKGGLHNTLYSLKAVKQYEKDYNLRYRREVLTTSQLTERWGISKQALSFQRKKAGGIPFIRVGPCSFAYRLSDVKKYERERK